VLGGAEISLVELVRCLDRSRFEAVAMLPGPGPLAEALEARGVAVYYAPLRRLKRTLNPFALGDYWLTRRAVQRRLSVLIREQGIHLVHANSVTAQLLTGNVAARLGVPCLWQCRDLRPLGALGAKLARSADRIVAVSQAVASLLASPKAVVVHNGVDVERFAPDVSGEAIRDEFGIPREAPVIGMTAQWVPWKRHDVFLAAARRVVETHPECRFLLAGDDLFGDHPALAAEIRRAADTEPLRGKLHLLGCRAEMPPVIAAMDVLVLPSEGEPFGRALIEAMAMARPVIAVRGAGPDDIVTPDCGVLLEAPEADSMAAALIRLLERPEERRRMGQAGRARVEDCFSAQRTASAIQAIYEELLQ